MTAPRVLGELAAAWRLQADRIAGDQPRAAAVLRRCADELLVRFSGLSLQPLPPTAAQQRVLDATRALTRELGGRAPTFSAVAAQCGFASLATLHEHLTHLRRKGYVVTTPTFTHGIRLTPLGLGERCITCGQDLKEAS